MFKVGDFAIRNRDENPVPNMLNLIVPNYKEFRGIEVNVGYGWGHEPHGRQMLEAMLDLKDEFKGATVADIGTGTGILAQAAVLLGAKEVIATDTHRGAVQVAKRLCSNMPVEVIKGTFPTKPVDIILCNVGNLTLWKSLDKRFTKFALGSPHDQLEDIRIWRAGEEDWRGSTARR